MSYFDLRDLLCVTWEEKCPAEDGHSKKKEWESAQVIGIEPMAPRLTVECSNP